MEIKIESKRNNPLLNRTEVHFIVMHEGEGTPNREIIRNELADKLNAKKENVIINTIRSGFGTQETTGYAKVYTSLKQSKGLERKHFLIRNKIITEETKKGEEKKEEKPAAPEGKPEETSEPQKEKEEKTEEKPEENSGQPKEEVASEPQKEEEKTEETDEQPEKKTDEKQKSEEKTPDEGSAEGKNKEESEGEDEKKE